MVPGRFVQPDSALADQKKSIPDQLRKTKTGITAGQSCLGHQSHRMEKLEIPQRKNNRHGTAGHTMPHRGPNTLCKNEKCPENTRCQNTPKLAGKAIQHVICNQSRHLSDEQWHKQIPEEYKNSKELLDQWAKENRKKPTHRWVELYKVGDQGDLELVKRYDWTTPPRKYRPRPEMYRRDTIRRYICSASPVIYDLPWKIYGMSLRKKLRGNDDLSTIILQITNEVRPHSSKLSWVLTIVMMLPVLLHAWPRRTTWHRLIFWVIFTAVFNLAGLLTYLALNHTTVIKCPACKKRRGLERTDCIRCTTELPTPEKRKTDLILHA